MLSQGKHAADVAMLYPIETLWAVHKFSEGGSKEAEFYETAFESLAKALRENALDMDYVDEEAIQKAKIQAGKITFGEETFQAVVLPPVLSLRGKTLEKLREFVKKGGVVTAFGRLPEVSLEKEFLFVKDEPDRVPELIRDRIQPDVTITPAELSSTLVFLHRATSDKDIYFFTNRSEKELHATVKFRAKGAPYLWHPETGEEEPLKVSVSLQVKLLFEPYESYFVVFKRSESPDIQAPLSLQDNKPMTAQSIRVTDGWSFYPEQKPEEKKPILLESWTKFGFSGFSGTGVYENTFALPAGCSPSSVLLSLGRVRHTAEVWVNGQLAEVRLWEPYDFNITHFVKQGENNLKILVTNSPANEARMKKEFPLPLSHLSPLEQDYWKSLKLAVQWTYFSEAALSSGLLGPVRIFWECL